MCLKLLCALPAGAETADTAVRAMVKKSLALTALCYLLKRPLLFLFGASEDSFVFADAYLKIYLLGTPFTVSIDMLGEGCTTGVSAHDRAATRFFYVRSMASPLWAVRVGASSDAPVPLSGSPTLHGSAHPVWKRGAEISTALKESSSWLVQPAPSRKPNKAFKHSSVVPRKTSFNRCTVP